MAKRDAVKSKESTMAKNGGTMTHMATVMSDKKAKSAAGSALNQRASGTTVAKSKSARSAGSSTSRHSAKSRSTGGVVAYTVGSRFTDGQVSAVVKRVLKES